MNQFDITSISENERPSPPTPDFTQPCFNLIGIYKDKTGLLATISIDGHDHPHDLRCKAEDLATFEAFRNLIADHYRVWCSHGSQEFATEIDREARWQITLVVAFNKGYYLGLE